MKATAIETGVELELAVHGQPEPALRIRLTEVVPFDGGALPRLWLRLGGPDGEAGAMELAPLGVVRGEAIFEVARLHPAGSRCPDELHDLQLGTELSPGQPEWPLSAVLSRVRAPRLYQPV